MAKSKDGKPKKTVIRSISERKKEEDNSNVNSVVESLESLLSLAKENKLQCFVFAGYSPDGDIISTYCGTELLEHQSLTSYLQSLATIRVLSEAIDISELD